MSTPRRRVAGLVTTLLVLVAASTSCSGGDDKTEAPAPSPSASRSSSAPPREVTTQVSLERVPGHLPGEVRQRVRRQIGDLVDRWFDAAYIGGRYPRNDFHDAFPGFTVSARAQAHHDKALMTNQPLAKRIDGVRATQRLVWIDVLPAGGRAAGATARFRLEYTTTGDVRKSVAVRGRLFLTPGPDGWKVFGYDVAKGTPEELQPPQPEKPQPKKTQKKTQSKKSHGKNDAKGGGR
jgi:hypothetical protein